MLFASCFIFNEHIFLFQKHQYLELKDIKKWKVSRIILLLFAGTIGFQYQSSTERIEFKMAFVFFSRI